MNSKLNIPTLLQKHPAACMYILILVFLTFGGVIYTGVSHLDKFLIVLISFIGFYYAGILLIRKTSIQPSLKQLNIPKNLIIYGIPTIAFGLWILDLVMLGGFPGFSIFDTTHQDQLISLRSNIHQDSPTIIKYLSSFNIRAFFPFSILILAIFKKKYFFWTLSIIGGVYAFGMMQKSFCIVIFLPTIIYFVFNKKFLKAFILVLLISGIITTIVAGSSDKVQGSNQTEKAISIPNNTSLSLRIVIGLSKRIFLVPGEIAAKWFDAVPKEKPFLKGQGYPIIPKLMGKEYIDYNKDLYPIIRPEYAERGYSGSVNTATFVREYANFGYWGLPLSSIFIAILFISINTIFIGHWKLFLSINLMYILLLSSSNHWTLLLSGGWIVLLFLFSLSKSEIILAIENEE